MTVRNYICATFLLLTLLPAQERNLRIDSSYDAYPLFFQAVETAAAGDLKQASIILDAVIKVLPFHREARLNKGILDDVSAGRLKKSHAISLFKFQKDFYNLKDTMVLERQIAQFSRQDKDYAPRYVLSGNYYYKEKRYDEALRDYSEAIRCAPGMAMAYYYRGQTYEGMNDPEGAIADYTHCLLIEPGFSAALYQRGVLYSVQKRYDEAITDFEQAMSLSNDESYHLKIVETYNNRGMYFLSQNAPEHALKDFSKAIEIDQRFGEPFLNRGMSYRSLDDYEAALSNFNMAESLGFLPTELYYFRGEVLNALDRKPEALEAYRQAVENDPANTRYAYVLGECYIHAQQFALAVPYLKNVVQGEPENAWAFYLLAFSFDNLKNYRDAVIYYEAFLELAPDSSFQHITHVKSRVKKLRRWLDAKGR